MEVNTYLIGAKYVEKNIRGIKQLTSVSRRVIKILIVEYRVHYTVMLFKVVNNAFPNKKKYIYNKKDKMK